MTETVDSKPESLIGITIGDYKIIDIIGQGGMGVVYTTEHTQLHHHTACKVLRAEMASHPETIERFLQEAKFISHIRHLNLIDIFDIGELPDKRLYYVMEKLIGRTLAQALQGQKMPFASIITIMNQLCAGLAAAHAAGLVHRDLKPDNLFLVERPGEAPLLKIMDFGVAKVMDLSSTEAKLTRTGYLVGTPQYMSPEQINGVAIDKRSDIYAVGIILYEMSTGRPPFRGDTLGQMLIAHLQQILPAIDPKLRNEDVPAGIEFIIRKALAKDPNERYASVQELSADFDRLVAGEPTQAASWYKEYQPRELAAIQTLSGNTINLPLGPPARRPRTLWLLATLLPGVLMCVVGGYLWLQHRQPSVQPGSKPPAPPKREEIDMLALRSYALTVLQEGLRDGDVQPRLLAVEALAASRDTRHHTLLEQRLTDPDPAVQARAATALGQIGARAAAKPLLKLSEETKDPKVALTAAEALARLGEPTARKLIEKLAKNPAEPRVQLLAALALEDLSESHEPQKLVAQRLANSPAPDELLLILTRRAQRGERAAQQQLTAQLADAAAPAGRQLHIAAVLNKQHSEPAKALLTKAAAERGPQQVLAAQLLCSADDPTALPVLRSAFSESSRPPYERLLAAEGLGGCGTRKDAGLLAKALRDGEKSPLLRQAEAGAILRLCSGDPAVLSEQSLTWAKAALTDENWTVRESAVAMLGEVDPQRAVPLLGQAIKDQRVEVRQSAAQALGRTKYRGAISVLGSAISDSSRVVRLDVLRSIGKVSTHLKQRGEQPLDAATQTELQKALVTTADTGDPGEQVLAAATLLRLGDESRRDKLKQALSADDPELKQLAIDEVSADPELSKTGLTGLLTDKVFAVRFHAACELAEQGRKDGVAVLREALGNRGVDGFKAYGLLRKLGESAPPPSDLAALLAVADADVRASVVGTATSLPVADAVPVLRQAVTDSSALVRQKVLAVVTGWSEADGTAHGLPIVRALADDADVALRSRANLLLTRLTPKAPPEPEEAPAPPSASAGQGASATPAAQPDLAVAPDLGTARDLGGALDLRGTSALIAPLAAPDLAPPVAPPHPAPAATPTPGPAAAVAPAAVTDEAAAVAPELDKAAAKLHVKQTLEASERLLSKGEYDKAIQMLETARKVVPSKNISLQLGQAYELWSEQESGSKQKALTRKAIDAYKQAKNATAKERIADLQQRLH